MTDSILVTGASGHLGRAVIRHLLDSRGVAPGRIVAATRDPARLADLAAKGIVVRAADFNDAASLPAAFSGVGTLLIVSTDALDGAGTRLRQHKAAVAAAVEAGVERIAYTSMPNPEGSRVTFAGDHLGTEQAIAASGLPFTIFRDGWYQENLMMALPQALASGHWYTSAGDGRIAHVARDDVAAAIAGSLASPSSESRTYTLTGATALTTAEIAGIAGRLLGRAIEVVQLSDEALAGGMKAAGVPEPYIPTFVSFDANTRAGAIDMVTGDVEALSGRAPAPLEAFFASHRAALAA